MQLLERDEPLRTLAELRSEAARGAGRLVLIEGEAGIGKTSLVRAFLRSLPAQTRAAIGACDPIATPRPFGPFLEVAPDLDPALAALIEDRGQPTAIFGAFLTALRREPGTVIVLDDLHWADEATLDLLRYVGRRIESAGALLIGTYRDDEVGGAHPLRVVVGDLATVATLTNDDTGATFVHKAFFHDVNWLDAANGVYRGMTNGQSVFWFFPGDVGPYGIVGADGLALRIEGTVLYAVDATTFAVTEFAFKGTVTNVCTLLSWRVAGAVGCFIVQWG
jgi:predicted ATPase